RRAVAGGVLAGPGVADGAGRGMSRSAGNLIEPHPVIERYGADAVRWFYLAGAGAEADLTLSEAALAEITDAVLRPYWKATAVLAREADAARVDRSAAGRSLCGHWLLSELGGLAREVTAGLEELRPAEAGRRIAGFLDMLCNWYLPASGAQFRADAPAPGRAGAVRTAAAVATLAQCLDVLTRLMAPIIPFLSDRAWQRLRVADRAPDLADSVHLAPWPDPIAEPADEVLAAQVALTRRLSWLARGARARARIDARQPLAKAVVVASG